MPIAFRQPDRASFHQVPVQLMLMVLIVGAGPIGLMHVMLAKLRGAAKVIVSEMQDAFAHAHDQKALKIMIES